MTPAHLVLLGTLLYAVAIYALARATRKRQ